MKTVQQTITPEMAKSYLLKNVSNRRLRKSWVAHLRSAMDRGEWQVTHQSIALTADGRVVDGQHRLHAVIAHGKPVEMMVMHGAPWDTFGVVDVGMKRTIEDNFGGKKEFTQPAAFLARLAFGHACSIAQIASIHNVTAGPSQALLDSCGTMRRGVTAAPVRAAGCLQILRGHDEAYILAVYKMVAMIDTANPLMPRIAHSFIAQAGASTVRGSTGGSRHHDLFVRSLSLFDKSKANFTKLQVNDVSGHLAEARRDILDLAGRVAR
jgi:hypothetical protein